MARRFIAEWEPQDAVLMAWPHEGTDWAPVLESVKPVFGRIAQQIAGRQRLLIVTPHKADTAAALQTFGVDMDRVLLAELETNDTWARDFGPLAVQDGGVRLLDFRFNAWGGKFEYDLDDVINQGLVDAGVLASPLESVDWVLEGGAVDTDGRGTLLASRRCVLDYARNDNADEGECEMLLRKRLGIHRFLWIEGAQLAGDDTDGHIDTLVRFADASTLLYMRCPVTTDRHYPDFLEMEQQLRELKSLEGRPYKLVPLPWPQAVEIEDGEPALPSYANFLIINGAVLAPTYGDPKDADALRILGGAFPGREIVPIDCRPLLHQGGSLHCLTMQLPAGALKKSS